MEHTFEKQTSADKERDRLAKLYDYNIVQDYDKRGTFQHVVSMAARIFEVPVASVTFVDDKKTLAEASIGLNGITEVDREFSICSLAILKDEVTVFEDTRQEPCLLTNPLVHGEFGLQFYAGASLTTPDGYNIGVVAVADKKPRTFSKEDELILQGLAAVVMEELEERLTVRSEQHLAWPEI